MNVAQIVTDDSQTAEQAPVFAPAMTSAPVAEVTLGRQNANDSDKSNYFESSYVG